LASVVGRDVIETTMLPLVLRMAQDPVPNIRFNVAKTLQTLIPLLDGNSNTSKVKPVLCKLNEDDDGDVKFFASQALQAMAAG